VTTYAWFAALQVITPLLRILEKMHSLKLLHRDIKPENIFLTGLGKFRLGDFGLAIKFDEEVPFSRSGTLDYMAPEVRQPSGWKLRLVLCSCSSVCKQQGCDGNGWHRNKVPGAACASACKLVLQLTGACLFDHRRC
jgi:serine/threonine protein kinase